MDGILLINKEKGYTSRDVVNIVGKNLNTRKVGHFGTLDPLATGLLILGIGKYTKFQKVMDKEIKEYDVEVKLGIKTDTYDITGNILDVEEIKDVDFNQLKQDLLSFKGKYMQEVPVYSAVKVNGKKLYEYARDKKCVILPKKEVELYSISNILLKEDILTFTCVVSKGFYIRSLINDLSNKTNILMTMNNLKRTRIDNFSINNSYTIEDIKNNNYSFCNIDNLLNYKRIEVDKNFEFKINNGVVLEEDYIDNKVLFTKNNLPFALYEKENGKYKIVFKF